MSSILAFVSLVVLGEIKKIRDYIVTIEQKGEREREIFKMCMDGLSFIAASYFSFTFFIHRSYSLNDVKPRKKIK
jgi:hypothetical protein